jgi:uncharacterized small protein (DUF1192 family)
LPPAPSDKPAYGPQLAPLAPDAMLSVHELGQRLTGLQERYERVESDLHDLQRRCHTS